MFLRPSGGLSTSNSRLLHDGRAATVRDAIEWHGGEAEASKLLFDELEAYDKEQLLEFVNGLQWIARFENYNGFSASYSEGSIDVLPRAACRAREGGGVIFDTPAH